MVLTDSVQVIVNRNNELSYSPVKNSEKSNTNPVSYVRCTKDFPIFLSEDAQIQLSDLSWKTVKNLIKGDKIRLELNTYTNMDPLKLPKISMEKVNPYNTISGRIKQPKKMTPDIAWLIGFIIARVSKYREFYALNLRAENFHSLDKLEKVLVKSFGIKDISQSFFHGRHAVEFSNPEFWHWLNVFVFTENIVNLSRFGIQTYRGVVPRIILQSPRNCIMAFLAGFFDSCGGLVLGKEKKMEIENMFMQKVSRELMQSIQQLFAYVGIESALLKVPRKGVADLYRLRYFKASKEVFKEFKKYSASIPKRAYLTEKEGDTIIVFDQLMELPVIATELPIKGKACIAGGVYVR